MRKWLKSIVTFALAVALVFAMVPVDSYATGAGDDISVAEVTIVASGECNETVEWSLDSEGVLTISGTGAMPDYAYNGTNSPWYSRRNSIKSIVMYIFFIFTILLINIY